MLTCFCTVFSFISTCVRARDDGRVCVCVHACAHVLLWSCVSTAVLSLQVTFLLGKKKHSCCLVTHLWLYIIYYTFLLLCQTFTKYDILSLLVSLCIIQSKMPYLPSIFCIDVLLYLHIGTCYCLCVQFVLSLYMCTWPW